MIVTKEIQMETDPSAEDFVAIVDITGRVKQHLVESNLTNGVVTVFVSHTTAGITVIEYEPGLIADFKAMWERTDE